MILKKGEGRIAAGGEGEGGEFKNTMKRNKCETIIGKALNEEKKGQELKVSKWGIR